MNLFSRPEDPVTAGLNEAQRYAVTLGNGPILVIAGAGTGKTRTLTHRVAWLVEQGARPSSILLLTFTRRASEEMLTRARALHPSCGAVEGGTFHSVCHRLLRRFGPRIGLDARFTVLDVADCQQLVAGVLEEGGLKPKGDRRFPRARSIADLISRSRNLEVGLEQLLEDHAPHLWEYLDPITQAAQGYTAAKRAQHLVDYDDLLFLTEELLKTDRELRDELARRWRQVLVDEYQDTNAVQARLVELLTQAHRNVMVVGDDAQSIYAFRGARLRNILEFPKKFPQTRVVKLEQNYRSTQPILDLTNAVISRATERYEKNLFTEEGEGPAPRLLRPREQKAQSRMVVERIAGLLEEGVPPEEIAVLFRAGRDSFDLEAELKASRLPFLKFGGIRFVELAHVKDVMAHLRVIQNPADFLSWQRILTLLPGIGPKGAQKLMGWIHEKGASSLGESPAAQRTPQLGELALLLDQIAAQGLTPLEMLEPVLEYYEPICRERHEDYPRRMKDLGELPDMARQAESLDDFLGATVLDPPEPPVDSPAGSPITLSTIHSAKGKEWDHVLVIWASDGRIPAFPTLDDPTALEEELRLFYVACTRAGQSLTLLAPREHYTEGVGMRYLEVCRFVEDLPAGLLELPREGAVFPVGSPAAPGLPPAPASRGSQRQERPFGVGQKVRHDKFGSGKVMGYKGENKVFVHFAKYGLKTLVLEYANLKPE